MESTLNGTRYLALVGAGLLVALASLGFVHEELRWGQAAVAVGLSAGVTGLVRGSWSYLPRFVTWWLDAGVLVVSILLVVVSTPLLQGIPYAVFRLPPTVALLAAASMLGTAIGGLAYTHNRLEREVQASSRQLALANERALESRLAALSAQINPHFLFNTLNVLAEVVHEDADLADDLLADLAAMMRYTLAQSTQKVSLAEEFDLLRRLLRLSEARLGDRLSSTVTVDPAVENARLPGLLLQPLVENALEHGVARHEAGGTVSVTAQRDDTFVVVRVHDSGPGIPSEVVESLTRPRMDAAHVGGLRNVAERVALTWPSATLTVDGSTVVVRFPLETA